MKIAYNGYIYEARNIPNEDQLREKYDAMNDSYYFSYRSINKIGLNPLSKWNTPNGVYTYNFKDIGNKEIPYRGDSPSGYMYVIKLKPDVNGIDSNTYNTIDLEQDLNKLKQFGYHIDSEKYYKISSPFKAIWTATYDVKKTPNDWTKILLALGYYYARDRGEGVIHSNEKSQTVFLSPKAYQIVDSGTYGHIALFVGTITEDWLRKNAASLGESNIISVAKFIAGYFKKYGVLPTYTIFNATNTKVLTDIYKNAFSLIGNDSIKNMLLDNPAILGNLGVTSEYAKHIIEQYPLAFSNSRNPGWLKAVVYDDRLQYVNKFIDAFKKITANNNIEWIKYLRIKDRIPMVRKLEKEINDNIINNPTTTNTLAYVLRPLSNEAADRELFDIITPSIKEITSKGQTTWLNSLLKESPELKAEKLTTTLHDEIADLIINDEVNFLNHFTINSDEEYQKAFKTIITTFAKYFKQEIKEYPYHIYWKMYSAPFRHIFEDAILK